MTNKELLQLQDTPEGRKVLGVELAELTCKGKSWHTPGSEEFKPYRITCGKCGGTFSYKDTCPVPDPITIDDSDACMGMAVRMFRDAAWTDRGIFNEAIRKVLPKNYCDKAERPWEFEPVAIRWILTRATAFEILKIIALAIKEKPNGTE